MSIEREFPGGKWPVVVRARAAAPPSMLWHLVATPARWSDWSPHIRSVDSASDGAGPAVLVVGRCLQVHSIWPVSVRADVTRLDEGHRWDFVARPPGPWSLTSAHAVTADAEGAGIAVAMRFAGPAAGVLDQTALRAYGLLAQVAVDRLARLAEHEAAAARPLRAS